MKIRSYKGGSLEKIYEAIRDELGPDAVVVSSQKSGTLGGLIGSSQHAVIAVAEDVEADHQLISRFQEAERMAIGQLANQQAEKLQSIESALQTVQARLQEMSVRPSPGSIPAGNACVTVHGWDMDARFAANLQEWAVAGSGERSWSDPAFREAVGGLFRVEESFPVQGSGRKPHVIALVGPTGVGKTTTLAKLAARWCLDSNLKIGLITADTYRVAAVDQIREYATLLGLELRVVFSAVEALQAVQAFADKDVILVDTPGRNFHDAAGMSALKGLLGHLGQPTILMLASAGMDPANLGTMLRCYEGLGKSYLVVTKLDEVRRYSLLTTLACETRVPLAFLTNGQRVPQDILPATRGLLAGLVCGTMEAEGSTVHA